MTQTPIVRCAAIALTALALALPSPLRADAPVLHFSTASNLGTATEAYLNGYRKKNRTKPVKAHPALMKAAQGHAEDMKKRGYFGHEGKGGTRPKDRLRKAGVRSCLTAENIAGGRSSLKAAMEGWYGSPKHRSNMLVKEMKVFGIGQSGDLWVLVLAQPC